MLAKRLMQRGVALSGALVLSRNVAAAAVPASLVNSTIKAASLCGQVSLKVAALTEGVLKTMLFTKLKSAMAVLVVKDVPVVGEARPGSDGLTLSTGKLELEVKEADDIKPPHIGEKPDMKGILSREPSGATEAGAVIIKSFFASMPLHHEGRLREFFDPRYLKKHGLRGPRDAEPQRPEAHV